MWGTVDILVANHGIFPTSRLEDTDVDFFDHVFSVNVRGVFLAVKSVLPTMVKNKKGRIILMSSTSGFIATPSLGIYVASKHAVEGLSKSFAAELTKYRDITCNVVQPGWIHTPAMETFAPDPPSFAAAAATVPLGFVGLPSDVAHACVYLASDEARYVTGKSICMDGGLTLSDVPEYP
ncbi:short-chain dehydrogenase/reductase SDR [Gonapodya prolifera JEL478]|uniref:3-oxoacyl-[acyl-carrier-protein] reductase n=1 Tax=Gonapodya prolifera (strain JEL478) TaxID=1344416 RepID=A0A139AK46_GONPJ|nr:short-chain dehydrogenase/reductase SDR [Gonapodya prolifera JEL478]|eukprot:KXS17149.1 short-chain dehydrogenase/reductase SDR [Gonapodya prolifera JEL478]